MLLTAACAQPRNFPLPLPLLSLEPCCSEGDWVVPDLLHGLARRLDREGLPRAGVSGGGSWARVHAAESALQVFVQHSSLDAVRVWLCPPLCTGCCSQSAWPR